MNGKDYIYTVGDKTMGWLSGFSLSVDNPDMALQNRHDLYAGIGAYLENSVFMDQVHGTHVHRVTASDAGAGAYNNTDAIEKTDALITNIPGMVLNILTADCAPIIIYDPKNHVIAAVHAGWRGSVNGIVTKTIQAMHTSYGSLPQNMHVYIGPCIQKSCYEVDNTVAGCIPDDIASKVITPSENPGKYCFDLPGYNACLLQNAGILPANIQKSDVCTHCDPDMYSHRASGGKDGRMLTSVLLLS